VLVPLVMTSPVVAANLHQIVQATVLLATDFEYQRSPTVPYEQRNFKASFCMTTSEYQLSAPDRKELGVSSLSKGLMMRDNLLAGNQIGNQWKDSTTGRTLTQDFDQKEADRHDEEQARIKERKLEMEKAEAKMSKWVFEESGVRVECRLYVWSLISIAASIVGGGLTMGFTIGQRIDGVDPFQLAAYCWPFAALFLLIAKSLRVEDWSWRDFILGQVFCRSVSELQAVTGINEQLILAKLLHDESTTILTTRGPFNCPFQRRSKDGFSIDRPISMWTMLLSGLIMLQVQTPQGGALVCLDARKGGDFSIVKQQNLPTEEEKYIICDQLPSRNEKNPTAQRLRLKRDTFSWRRVIGLYGSDDALFV
jgi:hypothetical protein